MASGGNDNKLFLWSLKNQGELNRFSNHTAAVKGYFYYIIQKK